MPTSFASTVSRFEKLTVMRSAPSTTWKFVTMWPALSTTKPEPSEEGSVPAAVSPIPLVAVTWTTPGAARS